MRRGTPGCSPRPARPYWERCGRRLWKRLPPCGESKRPTDAGAGNFARPRVPFRSAVGSGAAAGLDDLLEDALAVLDLVQTVIGERGVSVLVDVVGAEHRL